ncbi:2-C-methyl-D-erythritol 4-phosphate cytidylyltransferase [uncultured Jatrophihabitans sp.]|uniref:2-C-methyl-D-erythritol 4-phosphate cytidylyltransferase n=1 Tax=uncultured Jatrophihabitans sp. TaxID=1610747 RepID=UPI0035C9BFCA
MTSLRTVAAVLVAAGSGRRLGAALPKAFVAVAGRTLLEHATERFLAHPLVDVVVVVAPSELLGQARDLVPAAAVVAGGATRQDSVAAGLAAAGLAAAAGNLAAAGDHDVVLVHDVARPFVPAAVISAVVAAVRAGADAVVPVVAVHDTVRRVSADGELAEVVDRAFLVAVQTPQGFRPDVLAAAHARAAADPRGAPLTDDAGLVEAAGGRVVAVPGADESFKITTPGDLARAAALAGLGSAVIGPMEGVT